MQHMGMDIRVFRIPGGERASLSAYEKLSKLLEMHIDVSLTFIVDKINMMEHGRLPF